MANGIIYSLDACIKQLDEHIDGEYVDEEVTRVLSNNIAAIDSLIECVRAAINVKHIGNVTPLLKIIFSNNELVGHRYDDIDECLLIIIDHLLRVRNREYSKQIFEVLDNCNLGLVYAYTVIDHVGVNWRDYIYIPEEYVRALL